MEDREPSLLSMLAEKVMPQPIKLEHFAFCPTMDLIALATIHNQVHVYRFNGQKVFALPNKAPGREVVHLTWKPNGQTLAIAFSDLSVSLISSRTGKAVHQVQCSTYSKSQICCLGWGMNFTDTKRTKDHQKDPEVEGDPYDRLHKAFQTPNAQIPLDLPNELAFLDIEGLLPKLSVLPTGGTEDEVFSTRASLDAIFQTAKGDHNDSADVLLIGFEDGSIHLSIYDFFDIGTFSTNQVPNVPEDSRLLLQSNHLCSSTYALLLAGHSQLDAGLYFVPFDLRLIPETGRYLSLLASKSTRLYNVTRYIREAQLHIYSEFKNSQDLPRKFLRNIEETLQENDHCDFVSVAYHLVATGNCYPSVKEWLIDELGERGHKRWDKATSTGYENIRRLTHENLLPALERFGIIISRLRGLARFQDSITNLGLITQDFDRILDTLNCIQLLSHHVLISSGSELRQFLAFSAWLKQEIEAQGTDAPSAAAEDSAEKDQMLDYARIFEYIQGALLQSRLIELLGLQPEDDKREIWETSNDEVAIYEQFKKNVKSFSEGNPLDYKLPGLDNLIGRLERQCQKVFNQIAETQKRQVRFGDPVPLIRGHASFLDMRMHYEKPTGNTDICVTYIAVVVKGEEHYVQVYRVTLEVLNGISSTRAAEHASIHVAEERFQDVKFVDDETLMLASIGEASSHVLYLKYAKGAQSDGDLPYKVIDHVGSAQPTVNSPSNTLPLNLSDPATAEQYVRHRFSNGPSLKPEKIEVNGRKGRRVVCVVAQDKIHYRIFDIDSFEGAEGGDDRDVADEFD